MSSLMPEYCEYCSGTRFIEKTVEKMHYHKGQYYLFRGVPVIICRSCGERYWARPVLRQLTRQIQESLARVMNFEPGGPQSRGV
jgi:YgiT-type zinc finger domain-containing protein